MTTPDTLTARELVKAARRLERLMAQRRRVLVRLRALDDEIRTARKLVKDLTQPQAADVYLGSLDDKEPTNG
jgi:hypothetical protein